jgi:catechol 2,3-dioxygenase
MSDKITSGSTDLNIYRDTTRIGHVSLNVLDMDRSLEFYKKVLGFKTVERASTERAVLSVDEHHPPLVELLQIKDAKLAGYNPRRPDTIRRAGLYHFAILLPGRRYLADMLQNLSQRISEIWFDGFADHLVSESIYIRDPDNIGIEIYSDKPLVRWKWDGGKVRMATVKLDTDDLLRESTASGWRAMPAETIIGHVHLHVSNLAKAMVFYHDMLGLSHTATYPGAYFFAAGRYHHHIATNIWLGTNIQLASSEEIGLNHFSIKLPNEEQYQKTMEQLRQYKIDTPWNVRSSGSKSAFFRDTDGITIQLYS